MNNDYKQFLTTCSCGRKTSKEYAAAHGGKCKTCAEPEKFKVRLDDGNQQDLYHDYVASGACAAGVSFSDC